MFIVKTQTDLKIHYQLISFVNALFCLQTEHLNWCFCCVPRTQLFYYVANFSSPITTVLALTKQKCLFNTTIITCTALIIKIFYLCLLLKNNFTGKNEIVKQKFTNSFGLPQPKTAQNKWGCRLFFRFRDYEWILHEACFIQRK